MKRMVKLFLIFWGGIFVLSFFTAKAEMTIGQRLGYTAVLALVVPVLLLFRGKRLAGAKQKDCAAYTGYDLEVHLPLNPEVLYYIKNQKIYKEMSVEPIYELKGNKIYPYLSPKIAYRIENNKVYKGMEISPFLEIKGNKVYQNMSNKVVYEIKVLQ